MMSKVLITGATAYTGLVLTKSLLAQGFEVAALVRVTSDASVLPEHENLRLVYYDGQVDSMLAAFADFRPNVVLHLASHQVLDHKSTDVDVLLQSNIVLGTHLLEAMADQGCRALINTSTFWQFYQKSDYDPVNLYAATKQSMEAIIDFYVSRYDIDAITLTLFDTYGEDDFRNKLISLLIRVARSEEPLAMSGGEQIIDLVHISDVVSGYHKAIEMFQESKVSGHDRFALPGCQRMPLKDAVSLFEQALGRALPIEWGQRPYRDREVMAIHCPVPVLPEWKSTISLDEGFKRLLGREY